MGSQSNGLGPDDVKAIVALNNTLRDLSADRQACLDHLLQTLCKLTHSATAVLTEVSDLTAGRLPAIVSMVESGWLDGSQRRRFLGYTQDDVPHDPVVAPITAQAEAWATNASTLTVLRRQLVRDEAWYASVHFNELRRPAGLDDSIYSLFPLSEPGRYMGLCVVRAGEDGPFTETQRTIVDIVHESISWLHRNRDPAARTSLLGMPPRRFDVLRQLLAGDSEKQIGANLNLSRHTVHGHVKDLYRHFNVRSRGELMALFVANGNITPGEEPKGNGPGNGQDAGGGGT
jgi:DNA-binding CsgD family transcriptional regulator